MLYEFEENTIQGLKSKKNIAEMRISISVYFVCLANSPAFM